MSNNVFLIMKYESTIANNDANNEINGLICIDTQLIAVDIQVAAMPSPRVITQRVVLGVGNTRPMDSLRNTLWHTRCPAYNPLKKRQRAKAK